MRVFRTNWLWYLFLGSIAVMWVACAEGNTRSSDDDDDDGAGGGQAGSGQGGSAPGGSTPGGSGPGGSGSGGSAQGGAGGSFPVTTIQQIQQGSIPALTTVRLEGVVATTGLTEPYSECTVRTFWVQDPAGGEYSGIAVTFSVDTVTGVQISPGDVLNLEGEYDEFYELSNIELKDAADYEVVSQTSVPAPIPINNPCSISDWEPYEGVYVQVHNLTVSQTIADVGYGQFEVNSCLLIDSLFFEYTSCGSIDDTPDPGLGQSISSITGPVQYSYDVYKIEPPGPSAFQGWSP